MMNMVPSFELQSSLKTFNELDLNTKIDKLTLFLTMKNIFTIEQLLSKEDIVREDDLLFVFARVFGMTTDDLLRLIEERQSL